MDKPKRRNTNKKTHLTSKLRTPSSFAKHYYFVIMPVRPGIMADCPHSANELLCHTCQLSLTLSKDDMRRLCFQYTQHNLKALLLAEIVHSITDITGGVFESGLLLG